MKHFHGVFGKNGNDQLWRYAMKSDRTWSTSLRMDFFQLENTQQSGKWLSTESTARIPDQKQSLVIHNAQNGAPKDEVAMDANLIAPGYDGGEVVSPVVSQLNEDETRPFVLYTYAESDNARANLESQKKAHATQTRCENPPAK